MRGTVVRVRDGEVVVALHPAHGIPAAEERSLRGSGPRPAPYRVSR